MSSPLLTVRDLTVRFDGHEQAAVRGLSFDVHPGECVALVGESGSGKSLTTRALMGLTPPNARVSYATLRVPSPGGDSDAPPPGSAAWQTLRGASTAAVPQDALGALDPLRRVVHEVGDALRLHRIAAGSERQRRVVVALTDAGVPDASERLRQRADELSGGLRQRALIAAALIADPRLIIADEPTTALDAGYRGTVLAMLRARVEAGAGLLFVTHDLVSVRALADRVLVMRDGEIVEEGSASELLSRPTHPFTQQLIAAAPRPRVRSDHRLDAAPSETPARLELRQVSLSFGTRTVLRNASLTLGPGETIGLAGESGQGKTSLLRVALGLVRADAGQVLIDGVDRASLGRAARRSLRRRIAFVPQDPLDSFPRGRNGMAVLRDAFRASGVSRAERSSRARDAAEEVGLHPALLDRAPGTLSGGQRQRLAIARALAQDPALLLLDEPVSALDLTVQARVLELLSRVQRQRGTAFLFVSHDEEVLQQVSDRVFRLREGALILER